MGGQGGAGAAIGPAPGHRRLRLPRSVDIGIATIVAAFLTGGFGFAAIVVDHLTASPPPPANRGVVAEPSTPAKPRVTVTVRVPVPGVTITVTPTIEPVASPTGAAERSGSPPAHRGTVAAVVLDRVGTVLLSLGTAMAGFAALLVNLRRRRG